MEKIINNFNLEKYLFQYVPLSNTYQKVYYYRFIYINEQHLPHHSLYSPQGPYAVRIKNMDIIVL